MKTLYSVIALLLTTLAGFAADSPGRFIVHEWGTFTSVQGGDGVLLEWQPFVSKDLPEFVYNWSRPGPDRQMPVSMALSKGGIRALQRMETPVIYFYSDHELTADVTVKFPDGFITEWYPQAQEVGNEATRRAGRITNPFASDQSLKNSAISWSGVRVIPEGRFHHPLPALVNDGTDNHYFAARETDAAFVRVDKGGTNGTTPELEKLLFYRGAGNFSTPLKVTVNPDGEVAVANTGRAALNHLFLIEVRSGQGTWSRLDQVAGNSRQNWKRLGGSEDHFMPQDIFRAQLGAEIEKSLVAARLYQREAAAMVKTWSKSWFAEEGVRVLYLLPGSWTDRTLPITLNPQPDELVRVMVGRAEIIPLATQREIAGQIPLARQGDPQAERRLQEFSARLGRFYGPAWQLANKMERSPSFE